MINIGSAEWKKLIKDGALRMRITLNSEETDNLAAHAVELLKWNRRINLTTITDPKEVAVKHVLDSIAPFQFIPQDTSLLDIGSGGGFPGIPLKILIPSLSVLLIDASRKKINFLKYVIRILNLKQIHAMHIRAEELYKNKKNSNRFGVIICRALSSLDSFLLKAIPLLAKDGIILAMKGKEPVDEIQAIRNLSLQQPGQQEISLKNFDINVKRYTLPYLEVERSMIIFHNSNELLS